MCTAIAVLDAVRDSGQVPPERFGEVVARISFFVNAGVRFVEEMCKMRAFVQLWDELTQERYAVTDPVARRFRYGVQVNSLGLTEAQPENNVQRIVLEMLAVTLSKDARARAVQLPAWNEALGLPRPWDQQWSLRIQQVLALRATCSNTTTCSPGRSSSRPRSASSSRVPGPRSPGAGHGRGGRGGRVGLHEVGAGRLACPASPADRGRGGRRRRAQPVHLDRAQPAHGRPRHGHPDRRPGRREGGRRGDPGVAARAGRRPRGQGGAPRPSPGCGRRRDRGQPHGRHAGVRAGQGDDGRVGRGVARGVRRIPRPHGRFRVRSASGRGHASR
jgi:hypothetical protein